MSGLSDQIVTENSVIVFNFLKRAKRSFVLKNVLA